MKIEAFILGFSLFFALCGIIWMYWLHRQELLLEIRYYQVAMTLLLLAQLIQGLIALNQYISLEQNILLELQLIPLFNQVGVMFFFISLYIPQMGLNYDRLARYITITSILFLSAVVNAKTVQFHISEGEVIPEYQPIATFFNALSGIIVIGVLWYKYNYLKDISKQKERTLQLGKPLLLLAIIIFVGLIVLVIESTVGLITIYLVNFVFTIAMLDLIWIVKQHKYDIFMTNASFHGFAVLKLADMDLLGIGQSFIKHKDNDDILNNFISGPLSNLYYALQESVSSKKNLERLTFGKLEFLLLARDDFLFIYAVSSTNLIVDRLMTKYSEQLVKELKTGEAQQLVISAKASQLDKYFS